MEFTLVNCDDKVWIDPDKIIAFEQKPQNTLLIRCPGSITYVVQYPSGSFVNNLLAARAVIRKATINLMKKLK